jgi:hypothetical protein
LNYLNLKIVEGENMSLPNLRALGFAQLFVDITNFGYAQAKVAVTQYQLFDTPGGTEGFVKGTGKPDVNAAFPQDAFKHTATAVWYAFNGDQARFVLAADYHETEGEQLTDRAMADHNMDYNNNRWGMMLGMVAYQRNHDDNPDNDVDWETLQGMIKDAILNPSTR